MVRHHHPTTTATTIVTPPKKKKGRPSLHDIQQRKLQQQQQPNNDHHIINKNKKIDHQQISSQKNPNSPNSLPRRNRSSRRTSNVPAQFLLYSDSDLDSDDDRISKKVRRLTSDKTAEIALSPIHQDDEKGLKVTDTNNDTRILVGPTNASTSASATSLPDRKLLLLLIDRLQKKDTRGVFAEPVDPEELPDYHEIIENPMDFGTVRSKLDRGRYKTLEQFEDDVYLISSNAMEYNPPSTIFFRQARAIQELAKKEFESLRLEVGLSDPPPKPRRGRPPGSRNMKKFLESSPVDHGAVESPPDNVMATTPISREDDATKSGSYNLRKGPSLYRFPRKIENCFDFSASSSRYLSTKYGKKPCASEENRRDTYNPSLFVSEQDSLAAFGGSEKQLIPVGPSSDHNYARSLARFAGDLGPAIWSIVSKKIRSVLPPNVNFGPGWVDEIKASATQLSPFPDKSVQTTSLLQDSINIKPHSPLTSGFTNSTFGGIGELSYNSDWSSLNGINGGFTPNPSFQGQPSPATHPGMNIFESGSISQFQTPSSFFNPSQSSKAHAIGSTSLHSPPLDYDGMMSPETHIGAQGTPYWKNLSVQEKWDNGGFQVSSSRNSSLQIGSPPPQLDLVLQL